MVLFILLDIEILVNQFNDWYWVDELGFSYFYMDMDFICIFFLVFKYDIGLIK